jgi:hypothetical protein
METVEPLSVRLEVFAKQNDLGRTLIFRAAHPDPAYRAGLPFLPTLKVGRLRRVRLEAGRRWLAELERHRRG